MIVPANRLQLHFISCSGFVTILSFFSPVATTDSMQFINLFSLRLPLCCSWVHLKLAGFKQQFQTSYRWKQLSISRLDKWVGYLWKIWNLKYFSETISYEIASHVSLVSQILKIDLRFSRFKNPDKFCSQNFQWKLLPICKMLLLPCKGFIGAATMQCLREINSIENMLWCAGIDDVLVSLQTLSSYYDYRNVARIMTSNYVDAAAVFFVRMFFNDLLFFFS